MSVDPRPPMQAVPVLAPDPVAQLMADLPAQWHGEIIGPGIPGWEAVVRAGRHNATVLKLHGLPERLRIELAWMARWLSRDGMKINVPGFNQIARCLAWADGSGSTIPPSMIDIDWETFAEMHRMRFIDGRGRFPSPASAQNEMGVVFGVPRRALTARLHQGPWWELDTWSPRCDPRIPIRDREPNAATGVSPGDAQIAWLGESIKWTLGLALESGALTWSSIIARVSELRRFDRWLATLDDPAVITGDLQRASSLAATFRSWTRDPANRGKHGHQARPGSPRQLNNDLRAVADLMSSLVANRDETHKALGPTPWDSLTGSHSAVWRRHLTPDRGQSVTVEESHYVDDHALAQIIVYLPVLGAPRGQAVEASIDGVPAVFDGLGHPQAMRMLLLQILTGRRASEICLCPFDCLSPATPGALQAADGQAVARFQYGQSKIDQAPDTILVDAEVAAIVEEQRQWVRERYPHIQPRHLFLQLRANRNGTKHYATASYSYTLSKFSGLAQVTDTAGVPVRLSHTHRFRHTRITRLAELGLPVHVLQRYAGHTTPTMTMRYVAKREEHAEQAFLATRKFKADGTPVTFSQEHHDGMHLFDRADRFLPNGYCLLPPLQTCDKGNACLTCGVFVTDTSHLDTIQHQLDETTALIERNTAQFQDRHGKPMPADNVWLAQRTAERDAMIKLLAALQTTPGRAVQGAGCPSGPVPVTVDLTRHRKTQP